MSCTLLLSHLTFGCFFPLKFIAFGTGQTIICCGLTTDLKPLRSCLFVVQTPQTEVFCCKRDLMELVSLLN